MTLRLSFSRGLGKFDHQSGLPNSFKMALTHGATFEKYAVTPGIMGWQGDLETIFDFSYFDLDVTSRDLSVTLTVFGVNGR